MASKPEIEHGIDDKDTWWYRCPVCHDPLDYKQEICSWCYEVIEWEGDKSPIEAISLFHDMRDFTATELSQYNESMNKLFKSTGLNILNLC